ncbi:sugar-binding protein [Kiritimatiellota bacterium B12222]|nr:sugar-binding protein [Kiritimatiellota bacterium B12222]
MKKKRPHLQAVIASVLLCSPITLAQAPNKDIQIQPYLESFENTQGLNNWEILGQVHTQTGDAMKGHSSLRLSRSLQDINEPASAFSPPFTATPGVWTLSGASRAKIHSPDNSYHGAVHVSWMDENDTLLERQSIGETYNQSHWRTFSKQLRAPQNTAKGRWEFELRKTYGWVEVDDLKAVRNAKQPKEVNVERVVISADATGTLFLPEQPVILHTQVYSQKALTDNARRVSYAITDYWGAEYLSGELTLEQGSKQDGGFTYQASLDASAAPLPLNKYFAITMIVDPDGEAVQGFRSFARLPEAPSHQYAHEQIPFSLRNWDPRVANYVDIASRMGFRTVNSWGDYSPEKPEVADIYRADEFIKYDMKAEVGVRGVNRVERGNLEYMETLQEATVNLVNQLGDLAAYYCLGNEPHGGPEEIKRNVQAYKVAYEAIKATNPEAFVVSTSHGPDENYFKAGYHQYCDAYDFHIYESYQGIPSRIEKFNALGEQYGAVKPVFCTEMGVNSQGMTRHFVGVEMIKKFTTFFAYGGAHVSWFTIMYPDPTGRIYGSSTEAHNMFDARYGFYSPKFDAVVHYHFLNAYLDKKAVDKTLSATGTGQYLFANEQGNCLQVIWNDEQSESVWIPLPTDSTVRMIRIDGQDSTLQAAHGGITLNVGNEPILLLYDQQHPTLRPAEAGRIRITSDIHPLVRGEEIVIEVAGKNLAQMPLRLQMPPRWTSTQETLSDQSVQLHITAPRDTLAREGRILIQQTSNDGMQIGELALAIPMKGRIATRLVPSLDLATGTPVVEVNIANNGDKAQVLKWAFDLSAQFTIANGEYRMTQPQPPTAYFAEASSGEVLIEAGKDATIRVPITDANPYTLYQVESSITTPTGTVIQNERLMGGFAGVPKIDSAILVDGTLDEAAWKDAWVVDIQLAEQRYVIPRLVKTIAPWGGPDDLSGHLRMLWDDRYFYVSVEVKDNVFAGDKAKNQLWAQDGLQFMFDPSRISDQKPGAYDYSMGIGKDGPGVWRSWSASSSVPAGNAEDILFAANRLDESTGNIIYEVAFPWASLAPFTPEVGANLGMALILNEDDGNGRFGFLSWFGGVHSKELDLLGDLILIGDQQ